MLSQHLSEGKSGSWVGKESLHIGKAFTCALFEKYPNLATLGIKVLNIATVDVLVCDYVIPIDSLSHFYYLCLFIEAVSVYGFKGCI